MPIEVSLTNELSMFKALEVVLAALHDEIRIISNVRLNMPKLATAKLITAQDLTYMA